jgi:hypothetical protein
VLHAQRLSVHQSRSSENARFSTADVSWDEVGILYVCLSRIISLFWSDCCSHAAHFQQGKVRSHIWYAALWMKSTLIYFLTASSC